MEKGYKAYKQIGTLLIKEGLLTQEQLQEALVKQKESKDRLGNILVDLKYVSQRDLFRILGQQLNIEYVNKKFVEFYQLDTETTPIDEIEQVDFK